MSPASLFFGPMFSFPSQTDSPLYLFANETFFTLRGITTDTPASLSCFLKLLKGRDCFTWLCSQCICHSAKYLEVLKSTFLKQVSNDKILFLPTYNHSWLHILKYFWIPPPKFIFTKEIFSLYFVTFLSELSKKDMLDFIDLRN